MIAYKVVTTTGNPNKFKPYYRLGPMYQQTTYHMGVVATRESGCGPMVAFCDYYDALSWLMRMPADINDVPYAILKCDIRESQDKEVWGPDGLPDEARSRVSGVVYCDTVYPISVMPLGQIERI